MLYKMRIQLLIIKAAERNIAEYDWSQDAFKFSDEFAKIDSSYNHALECTWKIPWLVASTSIQYEDRALRMFPDKENALWRRLYIIA
jgi:hypothetical protein